ncbi:hypothetical protein E4U39_006091 [Claviceps sp. Clav50 group G5]|nr:hypothetical protein E4U39_006091 [Claviceps sp. Clav50 group G5]
MRSFCMAQQWMHISWASQFQIFPLHRCIAVQHRYATASRLEGNVLDPCAQPCQFQQQFGLPCAHTIRDLQDRDEDLTIQHIHPRWWIQSPQVLAIILTRELHCIGLTSIFRIPQTQFFKSRTPSESDGSSRPATGATFAVRIAPPPSQGGGQSTLHGSQASRPQLPSTRGTGNSQRLNASVRRTRTQAELLEMQATRGGRRFRGRSRGLTRGTSRGRANAPVARYEEGPSTPSSDDSAANETLDEIVVAFP